MKTVIHSLSRAQIHCGPVIGVSATDYQYAKSEHPGGSILISSQQQRVFIHTRTYCALPLPRGYLIARQECAVFP